MMQQGQQWRYPFFEDIVGIISNHVKGKDERSQLNPGNQAMVYTLKEGFLPKDRRWIHHVRVERMKQSSKVLYRPDIVNKLVQRMEKLLARHRGRGLMVKGPPGIGKSYSLINLTRYLLARGNYWVTIIPDCAQWRNSHDFFQFLLQSVGVDPDYFHLEYNAEVDLECRKLIHDIDTVLAAHGMPWVFIFDQIHHILARQDYQQVESIGMLPFPFSMMKEIIQPGRIISILSLSVTNDVSYQDNDAEFEIFEHKTQFKKEEIHLLYTPEKVALWDWEQVQYVTGLVPLYLRDWDSKGHGLYCGDVGYDIKFSLRKIQHEHTGQYWEAIVLSAIQCVLQLPLPRPPLCYDGKFSRVVVDTRVRQAYQANIVPLFPLVEEEYRNFFWQEISNYISQHEATLLQLCNKSDTSVNVRARLWKQLVMTRLVTNQLSTADFLKIFDDAQITIEKDDLVLAALDGQRFEVIRLQGQMYPDGISVANYRQYFVPLSPNFPAADIFLHVGTIVIVFHIHIHADDYHQDNEDVLPTLKRKVHQAQWNRKKIQKIILIYLSPTAKARNLLQANIGGRVTLSRAKARYIKLFYSIHDLDALRSLQFLAPP